MRRWLGIMLERVWDCEVGGKMGLYRKWGYRWALLTFVVAAWHWSYKRFIDLGLQLDETEWKRCNDIMLHLC